jgi:hypothetical protein
MTYFLLHHDFVYYSKRQNKTNFLATTFLTRNTTYYVTTTSILPYEAKIVIRWEASRHSGLNFFELFCRGADFQPAVLQVVPVQKPLKTHMHTTTNERGGK